MFVEDRHAGPAQIACTKIDFEEWLKSLPCRHRRIAQYLSLGNRTQTPPASSESEQRPRQQVRASWPDLEEIHGRSGGTAA